MSERIGNQSPAVEIRAGVIADEVQVGRGELNHIDPDARPDNGLSLIDRRPVLLAFLAAMLPALAAAITAFAQGEELRGVAASVFTAALLAAGKLVESKVTPVADPKLDADLPLVPDPDA